ncbi:hypothetical protein ACKWTF_008582 [Chironomus riparius]
MTDKRLSSILHHMAKFLIVTSTRNSQLGQVASTFFPKVGIFNFGLVYEKDEDIFVEVSNHFTNSTAILNATSLSASRKNPWKGISSKIFPDKLKNLNGYTYRIAYHHGMSYAHYIPENEKLVAKNQNFFKSVADLQNATLEFILIMATEQHDIQPVMENLILNQKMDVTISESRLTSPNTSKIFTYDEIAVCAMIPKSLKIEIAGLKLIDFRKNYTRKLLTILLVSSFMIVWRLYKNRGAVDSTWRIAFVGFAHFTGHHIKISRNNRRILLILLQTALFMAIFIKNFYECHISSIAINRKVDAKFESIEEILQYGKIQMAVDESVNDVLKDFAEYQEQVEKGFLDIAYKYGDKIEIIDEYVAARIAFTKCDYLDHYIRASKSVAHYMLPQRFYVRFLALDVPLLSPFAARLQNILSHAFDSGLTQKWETMYLTELFDIKNSNLKFYEGKDEHGQLITFRELKKPLKIIFALYSIATFVFLYEIFWNSFLKNLSWSLVLKIFECRQRNEPIRWESLGRIRRMLHFWRQRRTMNVRRVQVQPINV